MEEQDIADAMRGTLQHECKLIEGAAGVGVAALLQYARQGRLAGKTAVAIICGGNVSASVLLQVLQGQKGAAVAMSTPVSSQTDQEQARRQ